MRNLTTIAIGAAMLWLGLANGGAARSEEVVLDGLKSKTPADWVMQKPTSKLRAFQFQLKKVDGDPADAELVIFFFGTGSGGSVAENVKRWKGQFQPPKDKTIDDVSKVDEFKVGKVNVTYLDVHGTYLFRSPKDPNAQAKPFPHYRRFGVIFASENGPYFITVTGPEKTMAKHKKDFDGWLKNFK
jgi:hypothetical protein